jgi:rfaE bifunctional protein kinase chain/domain
VRPEVVSELTRNANGKAVTLDSRYDLLAYPGVTAATPNEEEAAAAIGHVALEWRRGKHRRRRAPRCSRDSSSEAVLITRGSRGMALLERNASEPLLIPVSGTDQVADVTGAGDTVIATFTLALAAGASYAEAAKLANYAGGVVVMKMGTATVSNDELAHAISATRS